MATQTMSDFLCVGDHVSLFCEETEGYAYNWQTSSANNGLFIYQKQHRDKPTNIPNSQAIQFKICIQNRFKLNKKYRRLVPQNQDGQTNLSEATLEEKTIQHQARLAAEAENEDNIAEQRRQHGKRVRYGEVIQLQHVFSQKYVHVSSTQTSRRDKNNMLVHLQSYNAKHAQFKILPRYKVKSEGEFVQIFDQIIFESVKSPAHYFHASDGWQIDHFSVGCELNLGIQPAGFTVVKNHRPSDDQKNIVKGGSVIRLFHKDLEAYVVAEGLFDDQITEDVHLRIREVDQLVPRSLYPSTSANTYWQIEAESSILNGDLLSWEEQVRFRHMCTRQYLCVTEDRRVTLTPDAADPNNVFRLHPVIKEGEVMQYENYARIEHVITGHWLHALREEEHIKKEMREANGEGGACMKSVKWDGADLRKMSASGNKLYRDAYTIQEVEPNNILNFNFASGMVPFLLNLILDRKDGKVLNAQKAHTICTALEEIKFFMIEKGVAVKKKQKLLRNLRIVDVLVKLLEIPLQDSVDEKHLAKVFKSAYGVLYTYMMGDSKKNGLYFAKYIDFFQTQITITEGDIGLSVVQMMVEMIRDNRKIVDRITQEQIEIFVGLLKQSKNYHYLDLLNVLCVCDGIGIQDNQTCITEHWLRKHQENPLRIRTERGQNVNGQPNVIHVSTGKTSKWVPLYRFIDKEDPSYSEDDAFFFHYQLDLYCKLVHGRNDFAIYTITKELHILSWEEVFLSLQSELHPDTVRAKYCELMIKLFIDVGTNYSVLDNINVSFVYEDVLSPGPNADGAYIKKMASMDNWIAQDGIIKDLVALFPVIRDWIDEFFVANTYMTASDVGKNILIEQVLKLIHFLVKFGYYSSDDIRLMLNPLINLLNGFNDKPFPPDAEKGFSKESQKILHSFKTKDRYEPSVETAAIANAKYQAMNVLDLILTFQSTTRLESFVSKFKTAKITQSNKKKKHRNVLCPLLDEDFDPFDQSKEAGTLQNKCMKELKAMFEATSYFQSDQLTSILMDLSNYKYDKMVSRSLALLNKFYSSKANLFKLAVRAMVLTTPDSCHVHREVARTMPILKRYSQSKLNDEQVETMGEVLDKFTGFCKLPNEDRRNPSNQDIMINHEALSLVFDILSQTIDSNLKDQYHGTEVILKKTLKLLKGLARGNGTVKMRMFERLDTLLKMKVVESDLAIALKETFIGNQATCLKILPRQIKTIVDLAAAHREKAPEFLDLLSVIVKVEGLGLTLKRNQTYVIKYIMQDYNRIAYVFDQPKEIREKILMLKAGQKHVKYFISLVELLATCAEGENQFIESMCQKIMSVDELLWVINHEEIDKNLKKAFMRYLLWVYMKTAGSAVESGAGDLPHDGRFWKFLNDTIKEVEELTAYISKNQETVTGLLKMAPVGIKTADADNIEAVVHVLLHYMLDSVMPVIQAFYSKFYSPEPKVYSQEIEDTDKLARTILGFCEVVIPLLSKPFHQKVIIACITSLTPASSIPDSVMEGLIEQISISNKNKKYEHQLRRNSKDYYGEEVQMNEFFNTFATNCSLIYGGYNTVKAQIGVKNNREYMELGGDEELPLGEEFQNHLKTFIYTHEKKPSKKLVLVNKLVQQLVISTKTYGKLQTDRARLEQDELDIRCLQQLRAIIHNEERKLPEDWEDNPSDYKKQFAVIKEYQNELNKMGTVVKALPHLARPNEALGKEVLALICIMLFNANSDVQTSLLKFFLGTREESFFAAIRNRMQLSALAIKEKRALLAQQMSRQREMMNQTSRRGTIMAADVLQEIDEIESEESRSQLCEERKFSLAQLQSMTAKRVKEAKNKPKSSKKKKRKDSQVGFNNEGFYEENISGEKSKKDQFELAEKRKPNGFVNDNYREKSDRKGELDTDRVENKEGGEDEMEEIDQKDDGYIELVLRVLASMCDGQHFELQNYLREQPDNMKSFNIVSETAGFLSLVYSNIDAQNINLVIQLFETLNECTAGNQQNRSVMLNNKIVDYINFILRTGEFKGCDMEKILDLKQSIGNILISLIEENAPESLQVAKEIKDTIDTEVLYRCMTTSFEKTAPDANRKGLNIGMSLPSTANLNQIAADDMQEDVSKNPDLKTKLEEVGYIYYLILARFNDIDPNAAKLYEKKITPLQKEAFNYFKRNTMSIEIIKDDHLQKINFRVKTQQFLREEVKEKMIWSVDRSSPSNKVRDLMQWSKDILKDVCYQRRVLNNPLARFFTRNWLFWNQMTILLSLTINILMLVTWDAQASLQDTTIAANATSLPAKLLDPFPKVNLAEYTYILYGLGGAHNLFSLLLLITYFLANHPSLPTLPTRQQIRGLCKKEKDDGGGTKKEEKHESNLEVKLFSFATLYYLIFAGLSGLGTYYQGYFFAFHLLNIVNNNQLLRGVIQAVTKNGKSLVWVAILGLVVFYLYGLVSFALLRSTFSPDNHLYCASLWQCTVTIIRYGLTGELFSFINPHAADHSFFQFGMLVIFNLSFFIFVTTIGLNIIFGIIVDTFSELRDLKWTAERDMLDTCFICSRGSYDFEHHGQGFEHHINHEHHIWAYMFFFIHLHDTMPNDYTALELYVHKLLNEDRNDFLPLNRALALRAVDEDSTDSKVDELVNNVNMIVARQKEEDLRKKRAEEQEKQQRWKDEHHRARRRDDDSDDDDDSPGGSGGAVKMTSNDTSGSTNTVVVAPPTQYRSCKCQFQDASTNTEQADEDFVKMSPIVITTQCQDASTNTDPSPIEVEIVTSSTMTQTTPPPTISRHCSTEELPEKLVFSQSPSIVIESDSDDIHEIVPRGENLDLTIETIEMEPEAETFTSIQPPATHPSNLRRLRSQNSLLSKTKKKVPKTTRSKSVDFRQFSYDSDGNMQPPTMDYNADESWEGSPLSQSGVPSLEPLLRFLQQQYNIPIGTVLPDETSEADGTPEQVSGRPQSLRPNTKSYDENMYQRAVMEPPLSRSVSHPEAVHSYDQNSQTDHHGSSDTIQMQSTLNDGDSPSLHSLTLEPVSEQIQLEYNAASSTEAKPEIPTPDQNNDVPEQPSLVTDKVSDDTNSGGQDVPQAHAPPVIKPVIEPDEQSMPTEAKPEIPTPDPTEIPTPDQNNDVPKQPSLVTDKVSDDTNSGGQDVPQAHAPPVIQPVIKPDEQSMPPPKDDHSETKPSPQPTNIVDKAEDNTVSDPVKDIAEAEPSKASETPTQRVESVIEIETAPPVGDPESASGATGGQPEMSRHSPAEVIHMEEAQDDNVAITPSMYSNRSLLDVIMNKLPSPFK